MTTIYAESLLDSIKTAVEALDNAISGSEMQVDVVAALPAGENHVGETAQPVALVDVALSLDTGAYADGDLMADTQEVASALRVNAGEGVVESVVVLDEDDQGQPFDLVFLEDNTSIGTENDALNISDENARKVLGIVEIASGDYIDLINSQMVVKTGVGLVIKAAAGSTSLYVAAVSRGTGTYTASGIRLRIGIKQS